MQPFDATFELVDIVAPEGYRLVGGVKGGAAGFAKGEADVKLQSLEDGTQLNYTVAASVGGKLAQVGSRLVDGAARKMADDFFAAFRDRLSAGAEGNVSSDAPDVNESSDAISAEEVIERSDDQQQAVPEGYEQTGNKMIWILAFVVLGLAMLFAF